MSDYSKKNIRKLFTTLDEHTRIGKKFLPPFVARLPLSPLSWKDDRLPEMLWASLIFTQVSQKEAINGLRIVLDFLNRQDETHIDLWDITLSGFNRWPKQCFFDLLNLLLQTDTQKAILRPLLLFEHLPAKDIWSKQIGQEAESCDWLLVSDAVEATLDQKSRVSMDCRWLRLAAAILRGKMRISTSSDTYKAIRNYSTSDLSPQDASLIRATENALSGLALHDMPDSPWPNLFWSEAFYGTPCIYAERDEKLTSLKVGTTMDRINSAWRSLVQHWMDTRETSAIDAKHDTAFGIAFYALLILEELLRMGNSTSIVARLALRTMLECSINIEYLVKKNEPGLWDKYRASGVGQAKLVFLKLAELNSEPEFVDIELLRGLANEDKQEELVTIDVGDWSGENLRDRAIFTGQKDLYDTYYVWSSQFAHGMWGAVRQTALDICTNPLHRMHLLPQLDDTALPDLLPDACKIIKQNITTLSNLYPSIEIKIEVE